MDRLADKTVERLGLYRRLLMNELVHNREYIYSYELAQIADITPSQVRRDLMVLNHVGNPNKGYKISDVIDEISGILGSAKIHNIALVGVGNLGKAILSYFMGRSLDLRIVAAFDVNPDLIDRVVAGCRCYHIDSMENAIKEHNVTMGILTLTPDSVQDVVDRMLLSNVKGFINFTHVPLKVPDGIFVENMDITLTIEKAAYFCSR